MSYISDIFECGLSIRYLQACTGLLPQVKGEGFILQSLEEIKTLFSKLGDMESIQAIQVKIGYLNNKYDEKGEIDKRDAFSLKEEVTIWRDRLIVLLRKKKVVDIRKDCILNLEMLMEGAESFFEEKSWENFPDIVRNDLEEGCFCILTSASTAAAVMLLRAIEGMLREYYLAKTGNEIEGENFMDWKEIIDELKELPDKNIGLIDLLNYLRLNLRNPASHPDKIFRKKESEMLFAMVVNTLEEMEKDIHNNH